VELVTGLSAITFGGWFLSPLVNTFESFPSYRYMASVATEDFWGIFFLLSGLIQLAGVVTHHSSVVVFGATLILFFRCFLLFGAIISTNFSSNAIPDFFFWASLSVFVIANRRMCR